MPRIDDDDVERPKHLNRIAIVDESDVSSDEKTHGLVDLAAALVATSWSGSPLVEKSEALFYAAHDVAERRAPGLCDVLTAMTVSQEDSVLYAARLGFALARTSAAADRGWSAWAAEAETWLRSVDCGIASHDRLDHTRDIAQLRKWDAEQDVGARSRTSGDQPPAIFVSLMQQLGRMIEEAFENHERGHHGRIAAALTTLTNTTLESLDEHLRVHHAGSPAPVQDPANPKARPTVEQQPRRQPAASKAATAPPVPHRAHAVGHVAAAVPQLDQCAGDDLELAGHRHPRASDPWFAEHGVG